MSANDHLEDVLSGIFAKTEGVSVLDGRSSGSMCARVERVQPQPRVGAPASSLVLRAVADAHKSLSNTPCTNTSWNCNCKELEPKEKEPVKEIEKVLDNQLQRLNSTSEESETHVNINIQEDEKKGKRKSIEVLDPPVVKKRKRIAIVFDVDKNVKVTDRVRERTVTNTHKYDSVPSLSAAQRKLVWCRLFPACRYGSVCAFAHPRCKFLAACTRRNCVYSHSPSAPVLLSSPYIAASHVVPAANFKSKSVVQNMVPIMCKFHPNCMNPACHFHHPKPCRYGNNCANKLECNFYHVNVPPKWRYTF